MENIKTLRLILTEGYAEYDFDFEMYKHAPELKKALEAHNFSWKHEWIEIYPEIELPPNVGGWRWDTDTVKDEYSLDIIFVPENRMEEFKSILDSLYKNWDIDMNPDGKVETTGENYIEYHGFLDVWDLKVKPLTNKDIDKDDEPTTFSQALPETTTSTIKTKEVTVNKPEAKAELEFSRALIKPCVSSIEKKKIEVTEPTYRVLLNASLASDYKLRDTAEDIAGFLSANNFLSDVTKNGTIIYVPISKYADFFSLIGPVCFGGFNIEDIKCDYADKVLYICPGREEKHIVTNTITKDTKEFTKSLVPKVNKPIIKERRESMSSIRFIKSAINVADFNTLTDLLPVERKSCKHSGSFATARKHLIYSGQACNKMLVKISSIGEEGSFGVNYSVQRDADSLLQRLGLMKVQDKFVGYVTDKNGNHRPRIFDNYSDEFITLDLSEAKGLLADILSQYKCVYVLRDAAKINVLVYNHSINMYVELDSKNPCRVSEKTMAEYKKKGIVTAYYTFMGSTSQQRKGCIEMIKQNI